MNPYFIIQPWNSKNIHAVVKKIKKNLKRFNKVEASILRGWSEANEKRKKKFEKLTDKINCDEIKNKSNSNYSQIYFILTKFSRHAAMEFLKKYYSRVFCDKFEFQIIKRTSLEVNYSKNSFQVCLSVLFCVIVSFMSIIFGFIYGFMVLQHPFTHGELSVVLGLLCRG